jgi:Na+-translocating ferredoxin:NAD+ oxidoreductase subunit G
VIPPAIHDNDLLADPLTLEGPDGAPLIVYRALEGLQVTGVAYRVSGIGYAGTIELLLGLDAAGTSWGRASSRMRKRPAWATRWRSPKGTGSWPSTD